MNYFPNLFTLNSTGCQTLYARIESNTNESCFSVGSFEVCGNSVAIGNSSNLNACNNSIDLTSNEADLLDGEDPNDYNITYYSSQENADDSTNELTDVTNFNGCQTIYVRVESANNTSCYQTTTFEACVKEVNAGTANNLTACTANDDLTSFDLTLTENSILNGENYSLSFYESQTDAENFQKGIDGDEYSENLISDPEVIISYFKSSSLCESKKIKNNIDNSFLSKRSL